MYLLLHKYHYQVVSVANDNEVVQAQNLFNSRGYQVKVLTQKPPAKRTLRRWKQTNRAKALDGCYVQGLCSCEHGTRSWLAIDMHSKPSWRA